MLIVWRFSLKICKKIITKRIPVIKCKQAVSANIYSEFGSKFQAKSGHNFKIFLNSDVLLKTNANFEFDLKVKRNLKKILNSNKFI
jgi:hypothetical protein